MRISRKFLKSSLIYTLAGSLPMASALILLPFYVTYLSTSDFGALSLYFAFSYFIQLVTTYSFDTSIYIHFHEFKNDSVKLSAFSSTAFLFMLGIGVCEGLILTAFGDLLFRNIFTADTVSFYPYGLLATLTGIFQAQFKVYGNLLQTREKAEVYFWSNVTFFALVAGVTVIGLKLYPASLIGPVGGRFLAALALGVWTLVRVFREFGITFDLPLLRNTFSFNFYTFIYQFLQWVINYFDKFLMLLLGVKLAQIGIYDFATKCLLILEFILNGLHNSFYPRVVSTIMSQETKGSSPEINRYYHGFISVILILICLCVLCLPLAIEIFITYFSDKPGYEEAARYIPYVGLIYIFRAIRLYYAAPYGVLKYTKPLSVIYLIVSVVKMVIIWISLDRFGLFGVIGASIIAAIVEILLLWGALKDRFRFRFNVWKIIVVPAAVFAMIILVEPVFGSQAPNLVHTLYLVTCLVLLGWVYRHEIKLINPFNILR